MQKVRLNINYIKYYYIIKYYAIKENLFPSVK